MGAVRRGVVKGLPYYKAQLAFGTDGWVELRPTSPPTIMQIPKARPVSQASTRVGQFPSVQTGAKNFKVPYTGQHWHSVFTRVVWADTGRFVAIRMELARNWQRLNPWSFRRLPAHWTLHRVCRYGGCSQPGFDSEGCSIVSGVVEGGGIPHPPHPRSLTQTQGVGGSGGQPPGSPAGGGGGRWAPQHTYLKMIPMTL